jgi:hypothetical protein
MASPFFRTFTNAAGENVNILGEIKKLSQACWDPKEGTFILTRIETDPIEFFR